MLLIGSRAARFHYPEFRKPKDFDFIATKQEAVEFLSKFKYKDTSTHEKKIRALVNVHGDKIGFEFELLDAPEYVSSKLIYKHDLIAAPIREDKILGINYHVATPTTLLLLKKSHITFPIHFDKNIEDYLFLNNKLKKHQFPFWWEFAFSTRFKEIQNRVNKKSMNFDVDNSEFFRKSEKFVKRVVEHDSLHYATCFYDKPLFLSAKEDISKAKLSLEKVDQMSHQDKIKMIQEECMALSLERYIIPALIAGEIFNQQVAYRKIANRMVYNYLPPFLRFFAADHFLEILDLKIDYLSKCLENHPTLKNIINKYENI